MFAPKVQICVSLPETVYKKFKVLCASENQSMTSRVSDMIKKDIEAYKENNK